MTYPDIIGFVHHRFPKPGTVILQSLLIDWTTGILLVDLLRAIWSGVLTPLNVFHHGVVAPVTSHVLLFASAKRKFFVAAVIAGIGYRAYLATWFSNIPKDLGECQMRQLFTFCWFLTQL